MPASWFITGANSGFGRLMTETLLKRGDRVAATYRNDGALEDLAQRYPALLVPIQLDLTDNERIAPAVAEAFQALGRIDIVISNAGYGTFGAVEELSPVQIRRQIETNLLGSIFSFTRCCLSCANKGAAVFFKSAPKAEGSAIRASACTTPANGVRRVLSKQSLRKSPTLASRCACWNLAPRRRTFLPGSTAHHLQPLMRTAR